MEAFFLSHEAALRFGAFAMVLAIMMVWETLAPRRGRVMMRRIRWPANFSLVLINTLCLRLLFPVLAVGVAYWSEVVGFGLFNFLFWPEWVEFLIVFVMLDALIYAQHVAFHYIPFLWYIHQVHHTDRDVDVTTALRFHPIEIIISMVLKIVVVILLGAPFEAVIIFEIVLNGSAMFNHANIKVPLVADRLLRLVIVTPDMHRVHHSAVAEETNSNFGFNFSWWDYAFGTYRHAPAKGQRDAILGLEDFQGSEPSGFLWILRLPFRRLMR